MLEWLLTGSNLIYLTILITTVCATIGYYFYDHNKKDDAQNVMLVALVTLFGAMMFSLVTTVEYEGYGDWEEVTSPVELNMHTEPMKSKADAELGKELGLDYQRFTTNMEGTMTTKKGTLLKKQTVVFDPKNLDAKDSLKVTSKVKKIEFRPLQTKKKTAFGVSGKPVSDTHDGQIKITIESED